MSSLVVFVHGLGANESEFWGKTPNTLKGCDHLSSRIDVRFWGYETTKRIRLHQRVLARFGAGKTLESVSSLGEHLWSKLRLWHQENEYHDIRLLGHSMGGLVVAAALGYGIKRNSPNDQDLIRALDAVAFVATPLGGASLADKAGPLFELFGDNVHVEDLAQGSKSREKLVSRFISEAVQRNRVSLTIFRASNDQVVNENEVDEPLINSEGANYRKDVLVGNHSGCVQDLGADSDNLKMLVNWANGDPLTSADIVERAKQGDFVSVFVSRPTMLNDRQNVFWQALDRMLSEYGLQGRTLGISDIQNSDGGMYDVLDLMRQCNGALILGFSQMHVENAVFKGGTTSVREQERCEFVTPWNHMEACMAFANELPLLIVKERNVQGDGVFDRSCLRLTPYETNLDLDWLENKLRPALEVWVDQVVKIVASRR